MGAEIQQWKRIAAEIRDVKKAYGLETKLGKRRTGFAEPPQVDCDISETLVEREPVTILLSRKGWIRAVKGHVTDLSGVSFKGDDTLQAAVFAETISKILIMSSDGKLFTLDASKIPSGRPPGEPLRLMVDIDPQVSVVAIWPYAAGEKRLLVASDGRGFVVSQEDLLSSTRKGRAVLSVEASAEACLAVPAVGDHVAVIGNNRRLLVFPLEQIPQMSRGKGVRLQRYKEGGLSDVSIFALQEGLSWRDLPTVVFMSRCRNCGITSAIARILVVCRRRDFLKTISSLALCNVIAEICNSYFFPYSRKNRSKACNVASDT